MKPDDFFYLGKVLRRQGHQGHLVVFLDSDNPSAYKRLKTVFADLQHERIPFLVESIQIGHKGKAILKLEDVDTADHADAFAGIQLYLPMADLPKLTGNRFYYHEIGGFSVIDAVAGDIGIVKEVLELPHQDVFRIIHGSKEILIPLVDEVIQKVDRRRKIIYIDAPAGLIDLYL